MAQHRRTSRSRAIAEAGITTATQFAAMMSATMADLSTGALTAQVANAMGNVGGKLLKVCEMQERYGRSTGPQGEKELILVKTQPALSAPPPKPKRK